MRRGEIYLVDLDPARSGAADKHRPVVIVSADSLNRTVDRLGAGAITVVPITSNVARIYDFQVFLPADETGLSQDSKAQAEQIRTISFGRLGRELVGHLSALQLRQLDAALRLHLSL